MSVTSVPASARLVWVPRAPRLRPRFMKARNAYRDRRERASGRRDRSGTGSDDEGIGSVAANVIGDGCLEGVGEWFLVAVAVIAVLVLAWFFLVPLLLFLVDAVVLVLVAAVAMVARVLFRRPWSIEVARGDQVIGTVSVVGLGNARRRRDELAASLAAGIDPVTLIDTPSRRT